MREPNRIYWEDVFTGKCSRHFVFSMGLFFLSLLLWVSPSPGKTENYPNIVSESQSIGQVFQSRHAGLNSILFEIAPAVPGDGILSITLFTDDQKSDQLAISQIPVSTISGQMWYRFNIPAQKDSYFHDYYLEIDVSGSGGISIPSYTNIDKSIEGGFYFQGQPSTGEIVLKFGFNQWEKLLGLVNQSIEWGLDFFTGFIVLVLPGFSLLLLLRKYLSITWVDCFALGAGISASVYAVVFQFFFMIGIKAGILFTWFIVILSVLLSIWLLVDLLKSPGVNRNSSIKSALELYKTPEFSLFFTLLLVTFTRFWMIRGLAGPLGSDAVQHGAITQLIFDNNGLFKSWLPYTPYQSFTTHFGFHVVTAMFAWVSHKDILQSILVISQIINVFSVFGLYPIVVMLTKGNRWAGVWSVLIAGLISSMPGYYFNWSRFPQLTGQMILLTTLALFIILMKKQSKWLIAAILTGLSIAGSFLAYYRMFFFVTLFIVAWIIIEGLTIIRIDYLRWRGVVSKLSIVLVISIAFILPWARVMSSSRLNDEEIHGTISKYEQVVSDYQTWQNLSFYASPLTLTFALAMGGVVISFMRGNWHSLTILLWYGMLSSVVALTLVKLPGADLMQSTVIIIALYIPIGMLGGIFLGEAYDYLRIIYKPTIFLIPILLMMTGLLFTPKMARIVSPDNHVFITWADLDAMKWIRTNTVPESKFFVNTQRFKETSAIGADGGWWLPILTGRQNNIPPQYALVLERPIEQGYNKYILQTSFNLERFSLSSPEGLQMLCKGGFEYVYVGQWIGYRGPKYEQSLISVEKLKGSKAFELVYNHNRVAIFRLLKNECTQN